MIRPQPKHKAIRLIGKAYTDFRKNVHNRAHGMCEKCGDWSPYLLGGRFDLIQCGHISHIKSRGAGGSDTMDNGEWLCFWCHRAKHDGK
jgi:hypothetical protein